MIVFSFNQPVTNRPLMWHMGPYLSVGHDIYIYIYIYIYTHTHTYLSIYIYIYIYIHTHIHIYLSIYLYIYIYIYIYIYRKLPNVVKGDETTLFSIATTPKCRGGRYSFPYMCVYIYIYIYIYIYTHTYIPIFLLIFVCLRYFIINFLEKIFLYFCTILIFFK